MEYNKKNNAYITSVIKAIDYIQLNYQKNINLEMIAKEGCFSPGHFHRIFKGVVGETPQEFLNRTRLEKASKLMDNDLSITDIALQTGFCSSSHFTKAFKKQYGILPKKWRSLKIKNNLYELQIDKVINIISIV